MQSSYKIISVVAATCRLVFAAQSERFVNKILLANPPIFVEMVADICYYKKKQRRGDK